MVRHFLGLYLLIVLTLAAVSWGQDKLLAAYDARDGADDRALAAALSAVEIQLHGAPVSAWAHLVDGIAKRTGGGYELYAATDIAGRDTVEKLKRGNIAYMQDAAGDTWR